MKKAKFWVENREKCSIKVLHKDKLIVFRKIARILSVFVVRRRAVVFWKARKNVFRVFLTRTKNY